MENELIVVWMFPDPAEAHLAKLTLAAEGIEAVIEDENVVSIQPLIANAVGGVKLLVRRDDVEPARQVLSARNESLQSRADAARHRCPN